MKFADLTHIIVWLPDLVNLSHFSTPIDAPHSALFSELVDCLAKMACMRSAPLVLVLLSDGTTLNLITAVTSKLQALVCQKSTRSAKISSLDTFVLEHSTQYAYAVKRTNTSTAAFAAVHEVKFGKVYIL